MFTLNLGATRVFHHITSVEQYDGSLDDDLTASDYYPALFYTGTAPAQFATQVQRYNQMQNRTASPVNWPGWPSWRVYPNTTETANVTLAIFDADSTSNDDVAAIVENADTSKRGVLVDQIPVKACVENVGGCISTEPRFTDAGNVDDSTKVEFRRSACVWSWVPGDAGIDPRSICAEETPEMRVYGTRRPEGNEGPSSFEFVVTLKPSIYTVTASVTASAGTAQSGSDFTLSQDTVTFLPGETRQVIKVYVHGDTTPEPDDTFSVTLGSPTSVDIATGYATGTIVNDDVPTARVGGVSLTEGNSGPRTFTFPVSLDGPSAMPVTLHYRTIDGSAEAGSDYVAVPSGVATIATGQTSASLALDVIGDYRVEGNETFAVVLEAPTGAVIADDGAQATGEIVNDDAPATVTAPGPQSGFEGNDDTIALGLLSDVRPVGPWTVVVKWGDATSETYSVVAAGALSRVHTYADNGSYTVTVSVKDADGVEADPVTFTATIANLAPKATLGNNGPIAEGDQATISFSGPSDPSPVDTSSGFRYAFSCSNESLASATYASSAATASTSCTFANNGSYTVRGRIIDKDGGANEYTTVVTVDDVAPTLTGAPGQSGSEGSSVAFSLGTLVDPGPDGGELCGDDRQRGADGHGDGRRRQRERCRHGRRRHQRHGCS